jgi:hypothetical protein
MKANAKRRIRRALWVLAMPLTYPAKYAEHRLDRAMTCPECGHGAEPDPVIRAEQADECDCVDDLCGCYRGDA